MAIIQVRYALPLALCMLSLSSCISDRFLKKEFDVLRAASDYYSQHGRWPQSRDELATGRDLDGKPLDVRPFNHVSFHPLNNGGIKIRWMEGTGMFRTMYEISSNLRPPSTQPCTRNAGE